MKTLGQTGDRWTKARLDEYCNLLDGEGQLIPSDLQ
jgi:hypothetical protein